MRPPHRLDELASWTYALVMAPLILVAVIAVLATWGDILRPLVDWIT